MVIGLQLEVMGLREALLLDMIRYKKDIPRIGWQEQ
jgi:hypothetical protein